MIKTRRILCMIDMLVSGGAQRQLVELAKGFKERGYDVQFLIYYKAFSDYYVPVLEQAGIPIEDVNESNYLLRIIKMRRKMKQYNPDVVIAFLEVPAFIAEMASLLPHEWRLIVGERSASPKKLINRRLRFFLHCHRFADYVVANSHANIDIVKKVAPEVKNEKLKVIYNSLDPQKFSYADDFTFCQNERRKIVIASSHQYLKNLDGLIEGVNLLSEEDKSKLKIDWYGHNKFSNYDHSYEEGMAKIKQYELEDVFEFHKDTLDIYQYMNEADAIGLFSKYEGFPNVICEGMFLGKPIIASTVSDIPLLLKEDENAFLCDPNSRESIARALDKFINSDADKLRIIGHNNKEKAKSLFDKNKILNEYEQLF